MTVRNALVLVSGVLKELPAGDTLAGLDLKAPIANPTFTGTVGGITKSMVGLGNADNTADSAKPISTATQTALDLKAPQASPTFTGALNANASVRLAPIALATLNVDCSAGNCFTKTIAANSTFTVSNTPAAGTRYAFELIVTHTSGVITWFAGVIWPDGTAPTLTTGKVHRFIFETLDGGTTWRAKADSNYAS